VETAATQHATVDDAENDFDLIEPRTMFRDVNKSDAMAGVRQKRAARGHRLQYASFFGGTQCRPIHAKLIRDRADQRFAAMRV